MPKKPEPLLTTVQQYTYFKNRIHSGYNFGRIKTYLDYLLELGHNRGELIYANGQDVVSKWATQLLTKETLTQELLKLLLKLEMKQQGIEYDKTRTHKEPSRADNELSYTQLRGEHSKDTLPPADKETKTDATPIIEAKVELVGEHEIKFSISDNKQAPSVGETISPHWTPQSQHPKQKAKLWKKQEITASHLYESIVHNGQQGALLNAGTGSGKTFVMGAILRRILDNGWKPLKESISPWPIVYITKASIVEQTARVLRNQFGIDTVSEVTVINIEALRATFGDMFIKWETLIENGVEFIRPIWKKNIHPVLFLWDECHILKNLDSQQSLVAQDVNNIEDRYGTKVYQVFASATAGARIIEFKCFAVATHGDVADRHSLTGKIQLTNRNWASFAKNIASPQDPEEYSPAALERFITYFLPNIFDIKGLRPQFHPLNRVEMIQFETIEDKQMYMAAWDDYQKKKAQFENSELLTSGQSRMMILAQFTIFRKTAEFIRRRTIAKRMYQAVQEGWAAVFAGCFKPTIAGAIKILMDDYHVPSSKISVIWGGIKDAQKEAKARKKMEQTNKAKAMTEEQKEQLIHNMILAGSSMEEIEAIINLQDELTQEKPTNEQSKDSRGVASIANMSKEEINHYKLGAQSKTQRQDEIDKFQSGQSLYCFFTFKAGGVGLSLHHSDELTKQKVRKHPNGDWALIEDIPKIPTRSRYVLLSPVYSAIELVQGLGRCARLTSLSDTLQTILFYQGTIEEKVAHSVSLKLKCLKKVVRSRESWEDIIINPDNLQEDLVELPKDTQQKQIEFPNKDNQDDPDDNVFLDGDAEDEES